MRPIFRVVIAVSIICAGSLGEIGRAQQAAQRNALADEQLYVPPVARLSDALSRVTDAATLEESLTTVETVLTDVKRSYPVASALHTQAANSCSNITEASARLLAAAAKKVRDLNEALKAASTAIKSNIDSETTRVSGLVPSIEKYKANAKLEDFRQMYNELLRLGNDLNLEDISFDKLNVSFERITRSCATSQEATRPNHAPADADRTSTAQQIPSMDICIINNSERRLYFSFQSDFGYAYRILEPHTESPRLQADPADVQTGVLCYDYSRPLSGGSCTNSMPLSKYKCPN